MNTTLRILHLEDMTSDADIVKREMTKSGISFEWCLASSKKSFQLALDEFHPDIVLSDHTLPGFTSTQALKMVREVGKTIPFILVTATVSEEFAASMIKEGVADYLLKDRLQRLPNAVLSAIEKCKRDGEKEAYLAEIIRREANLNAIIENSDVSIYSLDNEFRYITFNSLLKNTLKALYGLDINVGDNVFAFLKKLEPTEAREWEERYTEALSGKSLRFEKEFRFGEFYVCNSFSINPIRENDSVIGLSCFAHDITAQKLSQEKLRESEEQYRKLIETAQEGIWIIDEHNQTSFANKKLSEILGYTIDEIMEKHFSAFLDEDYKELAAEKIEVIKQKHKDTFDFQFITKSGMPVWTNLSINALTDNDGKYIGALAMVTDITKKKLYQESLKKSEANIRSLFDNTQVAYILVDPSFLIVSFNQVAARVYDWQLGKALVVGSNLSDYFKGHRKIMFEKDYRKVLKGERINYETHFYAPDRSLTWYQIQLSPVFSTAQEILGLVVAATDITEQKEAELQREKITSDLIQRNKDLEQFTYIVSHNLRAPVSNILGICNVLRLQDLTVDERQGIDEGILSSAKKLDDVIVDLNYILQLKRDINEKKETVFFSDLVSDIKLSIANLVEKENVTIITDFSAINEWLTLKGHLYSIFYNLISNSIKYRQADLDPVINITSTRLKNEIELTFTDNGVGIDLDKHSDKVFGLYKRFHVLETEGKGMGLYLVKAQVETLGGKISLTSAINEGCEFKINFDL